MKEEVRNALTAVLEDFGMFEEDYVLELERPRDPSHGDLTTNVALTLSKKLERKPRELAGEIAAQIDLDRDLVESVEIAGPGFINFRAASGWWVRAITEILEGGESFGRSEVGNGERVNLEFVSANPTGPFNIVSARAAAVGSALTRALRWSGHRAHSEFYCNDAGRQVKLFGASLRARFAEATGRDDVSVPEEGYRGDYVKDLAAELAADPSRVPELPEMPAVGRLQGRLPEVKGTPDTWMQLDEEESSAAFGRYALVRMITEQRRTCERFGLVYDTWFLESDLHRNDKLAPVLETLRASDHVFEREGAVWFRSTDFGDEKDRVLVKADGDATYFLADIAYHASKHDRGADRAIDFLGPDHHGHIARMVAATVALGYEDDWLEPIVLQQVNLIQDGEPLEMSKRAGRIVTMDALIDEVGADVAKYFFLARKNTSHMDFDLDLARAEKRENPVWYVKYAHARICSVLRNAEARSVDAGAVTPAQLKLLTHPLENDLLRLLPDLPRTVASAARSREMSRLTSYAYEVASAYHPFQKECRILGDDPDLTLARLALCRATRLVLANALGVLGIHPPEKM
ncbi:MAG TPA: arginine--tRNA ligase [Candidatus Krumholzibacteria bacterium]|nr:arginine--tRNA ligase [Candidatus Krumholzibacteria bacterium]